MPSYLLIAEMASGYATILHHSMLPRHNKACNAVNPPLCTQVSSSSQQLPTTKPKLQQAVTLDSVHLYLM